MIQVTPQTKILLCIAPVDFRRGIDGLAQLCRAELLSEPFSGAVFVFRNRRRTALKLLTAKGTGFSKSACRMVVSLGGPRRRARPRERWRSTSCKCCFGTAIPTKPQRNRCGGE